MTAAQGRRPKVCHVVIATEGVDWVFDQLVALRDRHGFDVAAIVGSNSGRLVEKLRAAAIPCHLAAGGHRRSLAPYYIFNLIRIFRRERFDIVQSHLFPDILWVRTAAWVADVPVRLAMFASPYHLASRTGGWIERVTNGMDTAVIPSCNYTRELLLGLGIPGERIADTIYYGPDERVFDTARAGVAPLRQQYGWPGDAPLIGMVAMFYGRQSLSRGVPPVLQGRGIKGQDIFIGAAPLVLKTFPDAKFLLAGDARDACGAEFLADMKKLAGSLGMKDSLVFAGYRNDAPDLYRAMDVSVQAALFENMGGTVESLLMCCPTVATRTGGMPEGISDGITGVLVEPDDAASLANGILRILRDKEWASGLAQAGRQIALTRFTLTVTAQDLAMLYRRTMAAPSGAYRMSVMLLRFPLAALAAIRIALGIKFLR